MILEYDPPLKKLSEEFGPHNKLLIRALVSLQNIYLRRNLDADTLRFGLKLKFLKTTTYDVSYNYVNDLCICSIHIERNKCSV